MLTPFLIYDDSIRAVPPSDADPPVGFVIHQIIDGVGFFIRLMIDPALQGQDYGHATMVEVIRRLRMIPNIEYIGTSVLKGNENTHTMYRNPGFVDGEKKDEREYYLKLNRDPRT